VKKKKTSHVPAFTYQVPNQVHTKNPTTTFTFPRKKKKI